MAKGRTVGGRWRAYWTRIVAQFEGSGERQADFCARRGLGLSSLHHWLYRLRRERRESEKPARRFVPLVVSPPASREGATACKLRLGGAEVSFAELPPASYVAELLRLMDR
ncbi:MAG: hypothetical protein ABI895_20165 [Deltaproteobacteria bacterium]